LPIRNGIPSDVLISRISYRPLHSIHDVLLVVVVVVVVVVEVVVVVVVGFGVTVKMQQTTNVKNAIPTCIKTPIVSSTTTLSVHFIIFF
jgi:hypothetical protein